jgi:hypothetical protein
MFCTGGAEQFFNPTFLDIQLSGRAASFYQPYLGTLSPARPSKVLF